MNARLIALSSLTLLTIAPASTTTAAEPAAGLTLWYDAPARRWSAEALPLGNGRLGCMLFGGTARERIQLNEDSLWTGDDNPSGDYGSMGAYQNFGNLLLELDGAAEEISCPSGHTAFYQHEEIGYSVDGRADTKWCLEHKGRAVAWRDGKLTGATIRSKSGLACRVRYGEIAARLEIPAGGTGRFPPPQD